MKIAKAARAAGFLLLLLTAFVLWFSVASDYSDQVAVGTYRYATENVSSILTLLADHTFKQQRTHSGRMEEAQGSWRRIGEGGIVLSKEFLAVPGEEQSPDGTSFCEMRKAFGIVPSLYLSQSNVLWYSKVDKASATSILGAYAGDREGSPSTLILNADHTYGQTVTVSGTPVLAAGTWNLQGETATFSKDFLKPSGMSLQKDEIATADRATGADLQIDIAILSETSQPIFRKMYFW